MSKFNVGDIVVRTHSYHAGMQVGDEATVAEVVFRNTVKLVEYPQSAHDTDNLELVPDAGLPAAPINVNYNEGTTGQTLTVKQSSSGQHVYVGFMGYMGTILDPNSVLQLCHDLRRMAMDIKRKEKANA